MKPKLILIGGGSASGKTYLCKELQFQMGSEVSTITLDNFYVNNTHMTFEERTKVNYDHPSSIDDDLLFKKAKELVDGHDIEIPIYDFSKHLRSDKTQPVKAARYVLVDGIFALYFPKLLEIASLKIFVDADEDVRLQRRIKRDTLERGRTKESVLKQFKEQVAPMHNIYIEPNKNNADIVFRNNENNGLDKAAVQNLVIKILSL